MSEPRCEELRSGEKPAGRTRSVRWWLAAVAPLVGVIGIGFIFFGILERHDVWPARTFVTLFYLALTSTIVSYGASSIGSRSITRRLPTVVCDLRGGLALVVGMLAFWIWLPMLSRPAVGWLLRQLALWRFG